MHKLLLCIFLITSGLLVAHAQCPTVTGTVSNVSCNGGADGAISLSVSGDTAGVSNPGLLISELRTDPPLGDSNFEWVELIATDFINFSVKPYTIIFSNNGTATTKGWVEGQIPTPPPRNSTYAFLIITGSVSPGDVVYVGGALMEPTGVKLRVKTTTTEAGDGGIGGAFTGASGVLGNGGGVADGIAVFNRHVSQIDSNTVPVDAIFFGTSIGDAALADTTTGFRLPNNDRYGGGRLTPGSYLAPEVLSFYSLQAGGIYNRSTGVYSTPRNWSTNTTAWSGSVSNVSVTGTSYAWSNGATTRNLSGLLPGNYTVTVTAGNGCSVSQAFTVMQSPPLSINLSSTNTSCPAASNGVVSSIVTGGNAPYGYLWSNGATTSSLNQRPVGTYTLTITDNKGCTASASIILSAGSSLPQVQLSSGPVICNGTNTGSINSAVSGGSTPYTYSWSTGTTAVSLTQHPAGTYSVTVTDTEGCSSTASASIQEAAPLILTSIFPPLNSSGFPVTVKGSNLSNITQVRFGTVNAGSFTVSGDSIIQAIVPPDAQSGPVTVINSNGCTGTGNVAFTYVPSNPELTVRLFIEGLYAGNGFMELPLVNSGLSSSSQHADSIELSLVDPNDLNTTSYKKSAVLFSPGQATITLPGWVLGNSYYLVIRHRNSVETWSKLPISFINENTYFNAGGTLSHPEVVTGNITAITNTTAVCSGIVQGNGGSTVSARGLCWSTSPKPTISLTTKTVNGSGSGSFSGNLIGLQSGTKYFVRAYATNNVGTAYGQELSFMTTDMPVDVDGNLYDTVVIGTQVWMTKNLQVGHYRNGQPISTNMGLAGVGAYAVYNNLPVNDSIYGKLYNWYAVNDSRGLCPTRWHVPSDSDWTVLQNYLGGSGVAGGKLKSIGEIGSGGLWKSPNVGATNSSGFTAHPGGSSGNQGLGGYGAWWTSTDNSSYSQPNCKLIYFSTADVSPQTAGKSNGFSVRCIKDVPPKMTTSSVTGVNSTSASCGGNITYSGGDSVIIRGVCWSISPNPTVSLSTKTTDGSGSGSFTSSITGLQPGTTYYVRAYATNVVGTGYGNEISFTTQSILPGQFADIDGNVYDTVTIGSQVWLKQNLKVSKYRNGDPITTNLYFGQWEITNIGAFSTYDNTTVNESIFGKLYNYYAVADPRGLCPAGWHVPTDVEWQTLEASLGMLPFSGELTSTAMRGSAQNVGGKMKVVASWWSAPNTGANNSSGFSALPGGSRFHSGIVNVGHIGFWWTSTQYSATDAWSRLIRSDDAGIARNTFSKTSGFSVRCVRD